MALSPATCSEPQRVEVLSALAACDGMPKRAAKRLQEQGVDIAWTEIRTMREQHAGTYQALASEISRAAEEALTLEYRELARMSQQVTRNYLADLLERQEDGTLTRDEQRALPQLVQAMQKVSQVSTDSLLKLTGRSVDGSSSDPLAAAKALIDMGVLEPVKRPVAIEGTAEEAK
jgi:hypothetical protein